jgi:hypothetical protein
MKPNKDQHVKIVLKDGISIEGIVDVWSISEVILKSIDGQSILIIPKPNEDIMLIKIILTENKKELKSPIEAKSELEQKFKETLENNPDPYDIEKNKTLAQLKIEMNKQEKKIISEKLKGHHASDIKPVQYSYPGFIKK